MRKVSIGFKGDPYLKLELKEEAQESEMTVSEYLESIVESRGVKDDVNLLKFRIRQSQQEKERVLAKLQDYEQRLIPVLQKLKGQNLQFRKEDGTTTTKKVHDTIDLLDCILSSINQNHE